MIGFLLIPYARTMCLLCKVGKTANESSILRRPAHLWDLRPDVNALLNKITPENFCTISAKLAAVEVNEF